MTESLIRAAIDASGMSARGFAVEILGRDERTIRRWLAGEPIPEVAVQWLEHWTYTLEPRERKYIVKALSSTLI